MGLLGSADAAACRLLSVHSLIGKRFDGCHTYSAAPDRQDGDPDIEHLNSLIKAARDAGLPTEYVTELERRQPNLTAGETTISPPSHPVAVPKRDGTGS